MPQTVVVNPWKQVEETLTGAGFAIRKRRKRRLQLYTVLEIEIGKKINGEWVRNINEYKKQIDAVLNPIGWKTPWYWGDKRTMKQRNGIWFIVYEKVGGA